MADTRPDTLVLLGDNVYADTKVAAGPGGIDLVFGSKFIPATTQDFEKHYKLLKEDPDFTQLVHMVGGYSSKGRLLATYDDHDYGVNNGDRSYVNRNASQTAFWNFLEVPKDSPLRSQDGVYNSRKITVPIGDGDFTYKVVMLDTRSNKQGPSYPHPSKGESATPVQTGDFLGEAQWQWLEAEMADDSADMILLGSGIQILPTDKILEELWYEYPAARKRLLSLLQHTRENFTPNVFILSGDVHTGEVLQGKWHCGGDAEGGGRKVEDDEDKRVATLLRHFYEFTSSGISHTFTRTTRKKPSLLSEAEREAMYGGEAGDKFNPKDGIEISRGYVYEALYDMYTATGVSQYRELRYGHHYRGLHYGVLDITANEDRGSNQENSYFNGYIMTFRILDQHNQAQMTTSHRLLSRKAMTLSGTRGEDYREMVATCDCLPVHGPETSFRKQLARYSLVWVPFIAVVCPLVVLLAFIFLAVAGARDHIASLLDVGIEGLSGKVEKVKKVFPESSNGSNLDDAAPAIGGKGVSRRRMDRTCRERLESSPRKFR
jgi:hypothetical protein